LSPAEFDVAVFGVQKPRPPQGFKPTASHVGLRALHVHPDEIDLTDVMSGGPFVKPKGLNLDGALEFDPWDDLGVFCRPTYRA
jgi:hypothetical protein